MKFFLFFSSFPPSGLGASWSVLISVIAMGCFACFFFGSREACFAASFEDVKIPSAVWEEMESRKMDGGQGWRLLGIFSVVLSTLHF